MHFPVFSDSSIFGKDSFRYNVLNLGVYWKEVIFPFKYVNFEI